MKHLLRYLLLFAIAATILDVSGRNLCGQDAAEETPKQAPEAPNEVTLDAARQLFLRGKYAEARESFELLTKKDALAAAIGIARCDAAVGKYEEAAATLSAAAEKHPHDALTRGMLADLNLQRGDYEAAQKWAAGAREIDQHQVAAQWVTAELHRLGGRMEEAEKAYDGLINFYNDSPEIKDAETLRYVGLSAAQYARWKRVHAQFSDLVNEFYPDLAEVEKNYWPAFLESGLLFLEKFNEADAERDFQAALNLNPNAAEVHAALARLALQSYELEKAKTSLRRALEINPNLLVARQLQADIEFANFDPSAAEKLLDKALPLCPVSEATLGRLAAARGCVDGLDKPLAETRMGTMIDEAIRRNPHCGEFFESLADSLDTMRRYPQAAHYFEEANRVMPQLVGTYGKLGLVHMRLGEEDDARKILEKAFKVDIGNVRVKNSLEVLDVLDGYETLETEHFRIRYDPKRDQLQARYIAEYLESVYPALCRQLGYFPKEKSLFEVFNRARNTRGHGWFSARMVGLPHIHTIGACAGKMVAMVSPGDMQQKFNWARVVKHELVHMINLQQTNFTIPHWFTEALAVYNEGYPRQQQWNEMLARRVPAGETYNLETINLGFIRPSSSEDWQMAYCQAEMYAEYMLERFGEGALAKMLSGFSDNLNTTDSIQRAFGVSLEDFEAGYKDFVKKIVDDLSVTQAPAPKKFSELEEAVQKEPENPDHLSALAMAYLSRKAFGKAGQLSERALGKKPKHQKATYVKARLQMLIGNTRGALTMLEEALDRDAPQTNLLQLLAGLKYKAKQYDAAAEFYQLGRTKFTGDATWTKLLARVYLKSGNDEKLAPLLAHLAEYDADNFTARMKLAQLALDAEDYPSAAKWATQAIHIDVRNDEAHRMLAASLVEQKQYDDAIEEYEVAVELKPQQLQLRFALADACVQAKQVDKARSVLEELLKLDPDYPGADVLLESLDK